MNRIALAAILATAGFAAVAAGPLAAQTAPPSAPLDSADRTITRDEALAVADARFDRMDANKDGKLDATEMAARRQPMAPGATATPADGATPAPASAPGNRLMARLDTNGDGVVDRAEYRAQAARRFDRMDANKDGKLDPAERQAARDAMGMRRGAAGAGAPPPADAPKPDAGQ
ncbi:MAG: EF-hand domain-containing protein [Proteobacteria bacterium]|nr:EF-hand domain-containing protein [Pseudomonadota bacterium]